MERKALTGKLAICTNSTRWRHNCEIINTDICGGAFGSANLPTEKMIISFTEWGPKLREAVVKWMNELSDAIDKNGGEPVFWDYKNLQDRFRQFTFSHTEILESLRKASFIKIMQGGDRRRQFNLTDVGWTYLVNENYSTLRLLLSDPIAQARNRAAITKREKRRKAYADPTMRMIDDFRNTVTFGRKELLKQLRRDRDTPYRMSSKAIKINGALHNHVKTPIANVRFQNVLIPLLAFETRKFWDLAQNGKGEILHEFTSLAWNYRRYATFKGKPYVGFLDIKRCHPGFSGSLPCELFPAFYDFGERLGWFLVYESDGVSIFADRNDKESASKLEQIIAFTREN